MQILVNRNQATSKATMSEISLDNVPGFFGLEPPPLAEHGKPVHIPAAVYEVWLRWSPKHNLWVPAVMDVPGHTNIEVHIGNGPDDTTDCLLVGMSRAFNKVLDSKTAWDAIMKRLMMCVPSTRVTIAYVDNYAGAAKHG